MQKDKLTIQKEIISIVKSASSVSQADLVTAMRRIDSSLTPAVAVEILGEMSKGTDRALEKKAKQGGTTYSLRVRVNV